MPPRMQQPQQQRRSERAFEAPVVYHVQGVTQFSLEYGENEQWLGCRFCGRWHRRGGGEFSQRSESMPLSTRFCTRWAQQQRQNLIDAGMAPLIPSLEDCNRHRAAGLDRQQKYLLENSNTLEEALQRLTAAREHATAVVEAEVAHSPLRNLRHELLRIEKYTDVRSKSTAFCDKQWEWAAAVGTCTSAVGLAKELETFLVNLTAAGRDTITQR